MAILHLEIRYFKKQRKSYPESYYCKCPNPQYTQYCNGLYVHTRRYQKECVECMKLHGTIDKHPLLAKLRPKKVEYNEYDILQV